jgi:asparagine synthase (glutamine-hydrolysing)
MCGIAGICAANGHRVEPERLASMIVMLDHRGPDGRGMHVEPAAGLAHARLSVIDVGGGAQPMSNEDGSLWITFNGEIFNYLELREDLLARGHHFASLSDTEVILHLYEELGADAVQKLNGQWAFAIWNARSRTLFLSRDRLGVRPLFYTQCGDHFLFASEVKALFAHPGVQREIDPLGLDNVFTFWTTLPPRTIFKGINELPPGHSLTWRNGHVSVERHWQPAFAPRESSVTSAAEERERLLDLLTGATRLRLRSDVPVGAYLSGGLDSSVVTSLAVRLSSAPVRTFSIAFGDAEFDESSHQQQVVKALGTDHHEVRCSHDDIARVMPEVVWHAETPLLRTSPAPMYLLAQAVRQDGYKVVLTGEGADEVLGGYDIFKEAKVRRFWAKFPESTRRALLVKRLYPYLPALQRQPAASLRAFFDDARGDAAHPCFSHLPRWRVTSRLKMLLSDGVRSAIGAYDGRADIASQLPAGFGAWDPFCQAQYLEMTQLLPGYILSSQGDRVAMAHGVESRFPFLDPELVQFASTLPPTLKMKALNEKYLLKQAARGLVPPAVWQRSKQPYRAPGAAVFFSAAGRGYVDDLLAPARLERDGIFDPAAVQRLVAKGVSRASDPTRGTLSVADDMALVGIISTQLILHRFINHFTPVGHGTAHSGTAHVHCR